MYYSSQNTAISMSLQFNPPQETESTLPFYAGANTSQVTSGS